jgi:ATPase subunit of ABC transporter with duplicated ATPase domains
MLTAHNLSKAFGLTPILKNITFSVNAGDRVGLVGPNGCGKTTLLRLLIDEERPDSGHVALTPSNLQIGYLAQGFEPELALKQYSPETGDWRLQTNSLQSPSPQSPITLGQLITRPWATRRGWKRNWPN